MKKEIYVWIENLWRDPKEPEFRRKSLEFQSNWKSCSVNQDLARLDRIPITSNEKFHLRWSWIKVIESEIDHQSGWIESNTHLLDYTEPNSTDIFYLTPVISEHATCTFRCATLTYPDLQLWSLSYSTDNYRFAIRSNYGEISGQWSMEYPLWASTWILSNFNYPSRASLNKYILVWR